MQFDDAPSFVDGLAFAMPASLKKWGIIDKHGAFLVQPQFDSAVEFHEGLNSNKGPETKVKPLATAL